MADPFDTLAPSSNPIVSSPRPLPPGSLIGNFEIVRVLADTSLSVVYLAFDRRTDTEAVLKEYAPQQLTRREHQALAPRTPADAAVLARGLHAFIGEAEVLMRFYTPTLVHVTELIEANDTAYQVMPQLGGVRLLDVRGEMYLPPDEAALRQLLDGLLEALEALHRHDTLHGAVAPGNILLLAEGRPLLLGPELARREIASGRVESLMASLESSFAAPETHAPSASQPLGVWSDLYSVAETLRYCISGVLPPPASTPLGAGRRETTAEMVVRRFGPRPGVRYSARLLAALDAALAPSTQERLQSVADFRAALGGPAVRGEASVGGSAAAPTPPSNPMPKPAPAAATAAPKPSPAQNPRHRRVEPGFDAAHSAPRPREQAPHAPTPEPRASRPMPLWPPRARLSQHTWWGGAALLLFVAVAAAAWHWSAPSVPTEEAPLAQSPAETAPPLSEPAAPPADTEAVSPAPLAKPAPTQAAPTHAAAPAASVAALSSATDHSRATSPRDACAGRTEFALYRCMQALCAQRGWAKHAQCERLRATDSVE